MNRMIEVPEEDLLALKDWRGDNKSHVTLIDVIDGLIACLPKQIEVGSRVRLNKDDMIATVVALDGDEAWVRWDDYPHHSTWLVASMVVVAEDLCMSCDGVGCDADGAECTRCDGTGLSDEHLP